MSRKSILTIIVSGAAFAALTVAACYAYVWLAATSLTSGLCGNHVISKVSSPDGKLEAYVFERSCGATTGVTTQVSILPAGEALPDEAGNICVVDVFPKVEVRWAGAKELVIIHHGGAKIFRAERSFEGVNIKYEVPTQAAAIQRHAADAHLSSSLESKGPCAPLMPGVRRLTS